MVRKEVKRDITKEILLFKCKVIIKYLSNKRVTLDSNKKKLGLKITAKLLIILNKKYSITEKQYEKIGKIIKRLIEYLIEK